MKPTQAQIEAAAKAMFLDDYSGEDYSWNHPDRAGQKAMYMNKAEIALTAAVIENEALNLRTRIMHFPIQATIERCAQVADKYVGTYGGAISIAAAIRALKDQS